MNPNALAGASNLGRFDRFVASDRAGLTAELQFGRDMATSRINLANPNSPGSWTGAPTFPAPRLARVGDADYLTIGAIDNAELTVIVAVEIPGAPAAGGALLGNYSVPGDFFQFGYKAGAGLRALVPSTAAEGYEQAALGTVPFGVSIFALRTTGAAAFTAKLDHFKGGDHIDGSAMVSANNRRVSQLPLRIGGSTTGAYMAGSTNIHGVAVYSGRCMSDAELLAEVRAITALAAAEGPLALALTRPANHAVRL
jgi:hypothetical protein